MTTSAHIRRIFENAKRGDWKALIQVARVNTI